jgi:hypothetical protein
MILLLLLVFLFATLLLVGGLALAGLLFWLGAHGVLRLFGRELTGYGIAKVALIATVIAAVVMLALIGSLTPATEIGVAIGAGLGWLMLRAEDC